MRRLSYADPRDAVVFVVGLAIAVAMGFFVGFKAYSYASSLNNYTSDEIYYVDSARRIMSYLGLNVGGWPYSGKTAEDYINPEHPPLGKYILGASMAICGDRPLCWRLPGVLEAALIPVILYIGYYAALSRKGSAAALAAGLSAASAAAADRAIAYEAAVAMLDIHLAFFTALAVAALAADRPRLFMVFAGLAGSVKYSGFFIVPALWLAVLAAGGRGRRGLRLFVESLLIPAAVLLATWTPLIALKGPDWFASEVYGALKWHTTSRPPGPPTSTPIGWLVNANPFYFSFSPMIGGEVTVPIHVLAFALAGVLASVSLYRRRAAPASFSYVSVIGGYLLLYALGNRTLYSFYVVQLSPVAAGVYGDAVLAAARGGGDGVEAESGDSPAREGGAGGG